MPIILEESLFSDNQFPTIRKFEQACIDRANNKGIQVEWNINSIAEENNLEVYSFDKECAFCQAIWLTFLDVTRSYKYVSVYKYQDLDSFLLSYDNIFNDYVLEEKINLKDTANWMNILFNMIPARKNKGLAMQIIPKFIEGWNAKYVTGSGQTKPTSDRVFIFEREGEVQANPRGKSRSKRPNFIKKRLIENNNSRNIIGTERKRKITEEINDDISSKIIKLDGFYKNIDNNLSLDSFDEHEQLAINLLHPNFFHSLKQDCA